MFRHPKVVLVLESAEAEQLVLQPGSQRPPPINWSCLSG